MKYNHILNIFALKQLSEYEKATRTGQVVQQCFIDMGKVFDRIRRKDVVSILERRNV